MRKTLTTLAACILYACPAFADQVWDTKLETALSIDNVNAQITALKDLLEHASEPQDKITARYHLAQAQSEQGYHGAAINHLQIALESTDKSFPQNIGQRDAIVTLLNAALHHAGRKDDARDLSSDNLARKDVLLSDIWAKNPKGLIHRQTALQCDNAVSDIVRIKTANFSAIGVDVACDYKFLSDHNNKITLYMTRSGGDGQANHDVSIARMLKNWKDSEIITQSQIADFQIDKASPILRTILKDDKAGFDSYYTGAWTTLIQNWVLKTRVTWNGNLGADFGDKYAESVMQNSAKNSFSHLESCQSKIWPKGEAAQAPDGGMETLLMMATQKPETIMLSRGETECLLMNSKDEQLILTAPISGPRIYTLDGSAISGEVFVAKKRSILAGISSIDEGNAEYILQSIWQPDVNEDSEGEIPIDATMKIYKIYGDAPSPEQVFSDFINAFNGKTSVIGSIDFLEGGNTQINIDPSSLNSEASDAP